ncbi:MAG: sugar kinase, partial [Rhizobiaceae bacterium]
MGPSVASIGECMLELSGSGGDNWRMGFAGDTFNTLWTMRALLPDTAAADYVSAFGDDPFSANQRGFMAEHGIGTARSPVVAGARPGLYAITLSGAERSFTYWRSDAAARQLASDPAALGESLAGRTLAYFSGFTLAILEPDARIVLFDALKKARAAGALVAFDPNYRARLWESEAAARETFSEALALTDIALPTFPDEQALYGDASMEATAKRMEAAGVGEIVVKDGAQPALLFG